MTNLNKSRGSMIRVIGLEKEEQIDKILPYQKKKTDNIFNKPLLQCKRESEEKIPKEKSDEKLLMSFVDLNVKYLLSDYLNDMKNESSSDERLKSQIESVQSTIVASEFNLNSIRQSIIENEEKSNLDERSKNSFVSLKEFKKKENNKRKSAFMNNSMLNKIKENNLSISIISPKQNIQESIISLASANNEQKKVIEKGLIKDFSPINCLNKKKTSHDKLLVKRIHSNIGLNNKNKYLDIKPEMRSRRKTMGFFEESKLQNFQKNNVSLIIPDSENKDVNDVRNIFDINEKQ